MNKVGSLRFTIPQSKGLAEYSSVECRSLQAETERHSSAIGGFLELELTVHATIKIIASLLVCEDYPRRKGSMDPGDQIVVG